MIKTSRKKHQNTDTFKSRSFLVLVMIYLGFLAITSRLFFWQIVKGNSLKQQARNQYERSITLTGKRGSIFTSDGYTLATNQKVYTLFAQPYILEKNPEEISKILTPYLLPELNDYVQATQSAVKEEIAEDFEHQIQEKLSKKDSKWISLKANISEDTKEKINSLNIPALGFDHHLKRYYPEASMAAHITGFVGKDESGNDIGYFGIEGALEKELEARSAKNTIFADALGLQLSGQNTINNNLIDGRDITTTVRRDIQHLLEEQIKLAVKKYGAQSGEVIVMDPKTGQILGLAAYPNYSQAEFYKYDSKFYKNPTLSNLYEPGSTFKTITVAAGIEEKAIEPDTKCTNCDGPRKFGKYTIRTWNNEYSPNITMEEALAKSDNIAMIFIAEKLGIDKFKDYLHKFGIGEKVGVELQEDTSTPFPDKWGEVKLATTSFGQGIVTNSMQVVKAVASIANGGIMMKPTIIKSVKNTTTGGIIVNQPVEERRTISKKTADTVTKMMINSAQHGEAQWTASDVYLVAGKTGTSQVVTENGYDDKKTIASFVGFAPPENPKFIMLTKLTEPTLSPWAAETAAPLWYKIANKLYLLLNIAPSKLEIK